MAIKVYISGICGSQEVRKQQQRVLFILQSLPIDLQVIDITEPGRDDDLVFMQEAAKKHDKKTQLPPQIFNDNEYCGDYADFELANDDDEIMKFLKLESGPSKVEMLQSGGLAGDTITQNGIENHEDSKEVTEKVETIDTIDTDSVPQQNELSSENKVTDDLEGSVNVQSEISVNSDKNTVENVPEEGEKHESSEESEEESE